MRIGLVWDSDNATAGQTIQVAHCRTGAWIYRRTVDRSLGGKTSYERARLDPDTRQRAGAWERIFDESVLPEIRG